MDFKEIDDLADRCKKRWQDHGRLFSSALYAYSRWRQLPEDEKAEGVMEMKVRLTLLNDWFDSMDNHEPTILDKLNAESGS